jgi:hypothetical protein
MSSGNDGTALFASLAAPSRTGSLHGRGPDPKWDCHFAFWGHYQYSCWSKLLRYHPHWRPEDVKVVSPGELSHRPRPGVCRPDFRAFEQGAQHG